MSEEIINKIIAILQSEQFDINEPITGGSELKEFPNWDSFKHLTFLIEVEKEFDIELSPQKINSIATVNDLIRQIKNDY